jgi:predicted Zn-dependent protease
VEYANPKLPEGINVTPEHPLKEFAQLAIGIGAVLAVAVVVLTSGVGPLAKLVPFRLETEIAQGYVPELPPPGALAEYLQALADRLARAARMPADMPITVHYLDEPVVNAMATVGGHVLLYRGLVQRVDHENGLALVLAHEIAHVRHRDPIVSLGRGFVLALVLQAIAGGTGSDSAARVLGNAGLLTVLSFNRAQERAADRAALGAVAAIYGHVAGADTFFRKLLEEPSQRFQDAGPQFLSTHPLTRARIDALHSLARDRGWAEQGTLTALPDAVRTGLRGQ